MASVAIVKCDDYTPSRVLRAVKEAIDLLGGIQAFVQPGQTILLKPNLLCARPPEHAVCTHPSVVEAVASLATAAGGECSIGDSPSTGAEDGDAYMRLFQITGMHDVILRTGIRPIRFDDAAVECEVPGAKVFRRFLLAEEVLRANALINICKFKTHELTLLTGAVKNLYGCIVGRRKVEYHLKAGDNPEMFAQVCVDLVRAVRPTLSIMDGIVGMDGQGPSSGRRRAFRVIIASPDPVALDAVACLAAGINPMSIPMLRLASEQGVGTAEPEKIQILGARIEEVQIPDFQLPHKKDMYNRLPRPVRQLLKGQLTYRPQFVASRCSKCGACLKICPTNAIKEGGKHFVIDHTKCIRCYCCQEVCPEQAIIIRTGRLRTFIEAGLAMRRRIRDRLRSS